MLSCSVSVGESGTWDLDIVIATARKGMERDKRGGKIKNRVQIIVSERVFLCKFFSPLVLRFYSYFAS